MKFNNKISYSDCPCGSGKSYKFCCLEAHRAEFKARIKAFREAKQKGLINPMAKSMLLTSLLGNPADLPSLIDKGEENEKAM